MDLLKKFLPYTGFFIFLFIIWKFIDFNSLIVVIKNINYTFFLPAIIGTFFIIYFKILRIYNVLKENNIKIEFLKYLEIYTNANILSQVTNLIFSETTAAIATMHGQESKTRVANIYFLLNLTDLLVIMSLCLISFCFNYDLIKNNLIFNFNSKLFFYIIALLFFLGLILVIFLFKKVLYILKDIKKLILNSYRTIFNYTIIIYFFYILACYLDARTFNINIDLFYLLFVYTMGSLISIIPISINGIGTREAAFIFLLKIYKITNEASFSLSLFAFFFVILFNLFMLYLFVILKKNLRE